MCNMCKNGLSVDDLKKIIELNNKQILKFTKIRHPLYKEDSTMFKKKYIEYCKKVAFYRKNVLDSDLTYSADYCLQQLYPDYRPIHKSIM